jgi:hypothetical protein
MKMARFVVDTHVHSQRTAAGAALKKKAESSSGETPSKYKYQDLAETLREVEPYDNSERLLYDMSCYGIDMCITRPSMSLGMNNELNAKLVENILTNLPPCATREAPSARRSRARSNGRSMPRSAKSTTYCPRANTSASAKACRSTRWCSRARSLSRHGRRESAR